ncbi:MAG: LiaF-related protein [Candidatus Saccharibacteria bacterium]|nr:LiaF-related protein [Candidatus Saccharibacteria bacterium]
MKTFRRVLWGLVFIALGVIFILKATNVITGDIFFKGWWTLLIIVPSIISLFDFTDKDGKFLNAFLIVLGVVMLLASQDVIAWEDMWKILAPSALVLIGLSILLSTIIGSSVKKKIDKANLANGKDGASYTAIFSGQEEKYPKGEFKGCSVSAVFGGIDLDLSNVTVSDVAIINASAVFGGVSICVPKGMKVQYTSNSLFGGVSNDANTESKKGAGTILINASCFCGGVDIVDELDKDLRRAAHKAAKEAKADKAAKKAKK